MALYVALRVEKAFDAVKAWIDSKEMGGIGVREVAGDNEHWHFLLETDKFKNLQSFRVQLTKAIPVLKGNASYSATKVEDKEKYMRYLCKGASEGESPEVAWRNSLLYSDEWVSERHEEYWQENKRLKKRKVGSVIDFVVDECKRANVDWKARDKIAVIYVTEIAKRAKPFNQFAAKAAVNAIQLQLCPDDSAIRMFAEAV